MYHYPVSVRLLVEYLESIGFLCLCDNFNTMMEKPKYTENLRVAFERLNGALGYLSRSEDLEGSEVYLKKALEDFRKRIDDCVALMDAQDGTEEIPYNYMSIENLSDCFCDGLSDFEHFDAFCCEVIKSKAMYYESTVKPTESAFRRIQRLAHKL